MSNNACLLDPKFFPPFSCDPELSELSLNNPNLVKPESFGFCGFYFRLSKYVVLNDTKVCDETALVKENL